MYKLTKTLLGGAALAALTSAPAMAQQNHPAFSFMALHAGHVVSKTKLHNDRYHCFPRSTCTFGVYSSVPASDLHKSVPLVGTFAKFNSNSTICSAPKTKIKSHKKSVYAKISTGTETYSLGCPSGPTTFYGDYYKLTDKSGEGHTDTFQSLLTGTFHNGSTKYKGRIVFDVSVAIGTD